MRNSKIYGGVTMFEKDKTYATFLCPTCKIPMLQCKYYGGGIYWTCSKCGCKVESTGL